MIMSKFKDLFLIVEGGHFSDREIKKENKKKVRGKDIPKCQTCEVGNSDLRSKGDVHREYNGVHLVK